MRTGGATGLLEKFPSMEASNSSDVQRFDEVDCRLLTIPGLQRPLEGGEALVQQISLRAGVVPSTPVLLNLCGVLFVPALFEAASALITCTTDIWSACGAYINAILVNKASCLFAPIFGSTRGVITEISSRKILIVQLLNNF